MSAEEFSVGQEEISKQDEIQSEISKEPEISVLGVVLLVGFVTLLIYKWWKYSFNPRVERNTPVENNTEDFHPNTEKIVSYREEQQKKFEETARKKAQEKKAGELKEIEEKAKKLGLSVFTWDKGHKLSDHPSEDRDQEYADAIDTLQRKLDAIAAKHSEAELDGNHSSNEQESETIQSQIASVKEEIQKSWLARENKLKEAPSVIRKRRTAASPSTDIKESNTNQSNLETEDESWLKTPLAYERKLKQLQDDEFEESLRNDQHKEQLAISAQQRVKERQDRRKTYKECLPNEPEDSKSTFVIAIRLPSGSKVVRRFLNSDSLASLIDFVDCNLQGEDDLEQYAVATHYPRRVLTSLDRKVLLRELFGDFPKQTVYVEKAE